MNIEELRAYCLSKNWVEESLPFDNNTLAFKVHGKIFALTGLEKFEFVNLKCDPEKAIEWREMYNGIKPGYHMNKTHWNSVYIDDDVEDALLLELVDHSYDLIYNSFSKSKRKALENG